ncbi:MAG: ATP-binding protein [Candidatus Omnitrophota bacterium]|nr:ATP-binding protein [Candidatus Omnitrophota bacterium]
MGNPFVFSKEVGEKNFCNRKKEIKELLGFARSSQNVMVFSQRRFGKTSLIKEVLKRAKKEGILTVYVDLYAALSEEQLVKSYSEAASNSLLSKTEKAFKNAGKLFKLLQPVLTHDDEGKPVFKVDIDRTKTIPLFEDVIDSVNRTVEKKRKKAVIVFDEFQQIGQFKNDRAEKVLRTHIQKHQNISYFFMGSKKHLIIDMFNNTNRPFYKLAAPYPLKKIKKGELVVFISEKFKNKRRKIDKETASLIVDICEQHPYYVQYLCYIIWDNTKTGGTINREEVTIGIKVLLEWTSPTYEATWGLLTTKQKKVLETIAKMSEEERMFSAELINRFGLGTPSSLQRSLKSLIDKDLIDREKDKYTIIDLFFKKWINNISGRKNYDDQA